MARLRKAQERGMTDIGWLDSRHTFSFGHYHDQKHMGYGALRVLNDDRVAPAQGFGTHPHRDMEIISYVVEGSLEHKDSMGTGSIIRPGDIQMMRAGTGVTHSEYNHSQDSMTRFLQIWIIPDTNNLEPGYQQIHRPASDYPNSFRLLVSKDGTDGSLQIARDANLWGLSLDGGEEATLDLPKKRNVWVQVVSGILTIDGQQLVEGDGLALDSIEQLVASSEEKVDALVFDLATV